MASTEFGTNDALTVKHWSARLAAETLGETFFRRFAGKSSNSIIVVLTDLESSAGDQIKYDLRTQTRDPGVQGDSELDGFEAPLTFFQDTVNVDQLRQAHEFRRMSQQRTTHDLREASKDSLKEWYRWVFDSLMLAYLAGVAGDDVENISSVLGAGGFAGNGLRAPDAAHLQTTGAALNIQDIDVSIEKAKIINPRIEPATIDGERVFVFIMHPIAVTSLMIDLSTDRASTWSDIQAMAQNRGSKNPIFTRALGYYHGVVLHESEFIPSTGTLRHNLFLGKQAGVFAMGNAFDKGDRASMGGGGYFNWVEQRGDYRNKKGVGVASVFGINKSVWNSADFAVIRVDSTDLAHT